MTSARPSVRDAEILPYRNSGQHIAEELHKLDLRIARLAAVLRARPDTKEAGNRHLYISDHEVESLLCPAAVSAPPEAAQLDAELASWEERVQARIEAGREVGIELSLPRLARLFGLTPLEVEALVICLAPELDRKYDRLYAYLQDDITRRKPSVDLILDLLCAGRDERWQARTLLVEPAPLLHFRLLETTQDPHSPSGSSGLASFLKLDPRILSFLLESPALAPQLVATARLARQLPPLESVPVGETIKRRLQWLSRRVLADPPQNGSRSLTIHLRGSYGVGKRELAMGICAELGCSLLVLDAQLLPSNTIEAVPLLQLAFREAVLQQSGLAILHLDDYLEHGKSARPGLSRLDEMIAQYGGLTFLLGEKAWPSQGVFGNTVFQSFKIPLPPAPLREAVWLEVLKEQAVTENPDNQAMDSDDAGNGRSVGVLTREKAEGWAERLARSFRLTPGQIRDAAQEIERQNWMGSFQRPTFDDLAGACRAQSHQRLHDLAVKIDPRRSWRDLVLPDEKLSHLREICLQVRHHYRVFKDWGFDRKLSYGKGLSALFSGPPGTGKTLAAEVLAYELGLDLYRIDLSSVVSKYIGETEKNLARIFQEAEASNAILFFDEADALFGKRTEISDAHDRYANIETSYLLQRMEEYEGMTILATNLRQNLDQAFVRRLRFIVEFPFPSAEQRLRIWSTLIPAQTPIVEGVDFEFLARTFEVAGGNIKNIVLNAAFLAAENGGSVAMEHLLQGTRREYEKIGKLWNEKLSAPPPAHDEADDA